MPEVKCPTCGKEVADSAVHCVFCGSRLYSDGEMLKPSETRKEPLEPKADKNDSKFFIFIVILITITGIVLFIHFN
jgi:hypothetical protein